MYWELLGKLIFIPAFLVFVITLNGWALSVLWGWFVVPVFNVNNLSVIQALGISVVVSFFKGYQETVEVKKQQWVAAFGKVASWPLSTLAYGWVIHLMLG